MSTNLSDSPASIAQHLWKRMLGVQNLPLGANFFELGGDSLLAVHFLAEFNLRTGSKVKMVQFMADPTVHNVVNLLGSSTATPSTPIRPLRRDIASPDSSPRSQPQARIEPPRRRDDESPPPPQSAAMDREALQRDEAEIRVFLDRFVEAMCSRDGAGLGALFAQDERSMLVTVGDSIIEGSATITKHYTRKTSSLHEVRAQVREAKIFVFAGGRAASITARLDSDQTFAEGNRRVEYRDTRLTLVLEKHEGAWRTVHMHYSLPVGGPVDTLG